MADYPKEILDLILNARFAGGLDAANALGKAACFECGTSIKLDLEIDEADKTIKHCGYATTGCGFAIAAAETVFSDISGTKLTELGGDTHRRFAELISNQTDKEVFGREHCRAMFLTAFQNMLTNYRRQVVSANELVCSCYGVSETAIRDAIIDGQLMSVEDVGDAISAGTGCGSCRFVIQEMIDNMTEEF